MDTEQTYTLEDLRNFDFAGTALCVIGQPIQHSISPAMHNAALEALSQDEAMFKDWSYFRFEIAPDDLKEALSLFQEKQFKGINLTVPHKVDAVGMITDISEEASRMAAVNTLRFEKDAFHGFNTDGYGLETAVREDLDREFEGSVIVLVGAGGAARAAAVQCVASGCSRLIIVNRSKERAEKLRADLVRNYPSAQIDIVAPTEDIDGLAPSGILINATSLGLRSEDAAPFDLEKLPENWVVYDMIYSAKTQLQQQAENLKIRYSDGLSMLVHQGARALELWTGLPIDASIMERAAKIALKR